MSDDFIRRTVNFEHAFKLPGVQEPQPPGNYAIHEDRELIEGVSRLAYKTTSTAIELRSLTDGRVSLVPVKQEDLEAALAADQLAVTP